MKKLLIGLLMLSSFSAYSKDICTEDVTKDLVGNYYATNQAQQCPKFITVECKDKIPSLEWRRYLTSHGVTSIWSYKKRTITTARVARIEGNDLVFRVHDSKFTLKNIDIPFFLKRNIEVFKLRKNNNELSIDVSGTNNHFAESFNGPCRYEEFSDEDAAEIRREEYLNLPMWQNERYQYPTWDDYINR